MPLMLPFSSQTCRATVDGILYTLSSAQAKRLGHKVPRSVIYLTRDGEVMSTQLKAFRAGNATDTLLLRPARSSSPKTELATNTMTHLGSGFDSRHEMKFAEFLRALQLRFEAHPTSINVPNLRGRAQYTPDFYIPSLELFVEIKPRRPDLETMERCAHLSRAFPAMRVACIYGGFRPPIVNHVPKSYTFKHADGLSAMVWRNGVLQAGVGAFVVREHGVELACVTDLASGAGYQHPTLLRAYKSADTHF